MKIRKNIIEQEPAWKTRQKELRKQARKSKLWIVLGVVIGVVVVGVMTFGVIKAYRLRPAKELAKVKPKHAIARVVDKRVETEAGKTRRLIGFRIGRFVANTAMSESKFSSLQKDDLVEVTYQDAPPPALLKVTDWRLYKPASKD